MAQISYSKHGENWLAGLSDQIDAFSSKTTPEETIKFVINIAEEKQDPDAVKWLVMLYSHQIENPPYLVNSVLENWVLNCLKKLARGENSKNAFLLKDKVGRPEGSTSVSHLQISCAYEYMRRHGYTSEKAIELCEQKFALSDFQIARIVRSLKIPKYIDSKLLYELSLKDYSYLWTPAI